jgi:predicted Zn-ribbon and HTH transcriptional regulator
VKQHRIDQPALELADIVRRFGTEFVARNNASLSWQQRRVIEAIERCRTAALGGHKEACNGCGHESFSYNSCRNRHCPKCQAGARAKWMNDREAELLPVSYFHTVFTLPQTMAGLALQNKEVMYDILFQSTSETLQEVAANPKHLGAKIGFFAVLHTWGQKMENHPHLHCVIPAGGLSPDNQQWKHCKRSRKTGKEFFLPVAVLSAVFRGKFIDFLRQAHQQNKLSFFGKFAGLQDGDEFERFLDASVKSNWVVFAKKPFANTQCVLKYLARYTHRIAISNSRLIAVEGDEVVFRWKNYRKDCAMETTRLPASEFLRRFLQHVLPKGYTRIRHFGILSNRLRASAIELCRDLLGDRDNSDNEPSDEIEHRDDKPKSCPACKTGQMFRIDSWERGERGMPATSLHRGMHLELHLLALHKL